MRRYLLDTGIAGCYVDRRLGVFEKAKLKLNWGIGSALPIPTSPNWPTGWKVARIAIATCNGFNWHSPPGSSGLVTEEAAFEYGRIAAELRRLGRPIGQNDMMIAAIAFTLGNCTVITMDSDLPPYQD